MYIYVCIYIMYLTIRIYLIVFIQCSELKHPTNTGHLFVTNKHDQRPPQLTTFSPTSTDCDDLSPMTWCSAAMHKLRFGVFVRAPGEAAAETPPEMARSGNEPFRIWNTMNINEIKWKDVNETTSNNYNSKDVVTLQSLRSAPWFREKTQM